MKHDVEQSSGSLYADLGYKNPEEMEAKATLAREIYRIIKKKKLSQTKASKLLGIQQPTLSNLLRGRISGFSTDRLLRFLKQLGQDIDIRVKPSRRKRSVGKISVHTETSEMSIPLAARSRDC